MIPNPNKPFWSESVRNLAWMLAGLSLTVFWFTAFKVCLKWLGRNMVLALVLLTISSPLYAEEILYDFGATWCKVCKAMTPTMEQLRARGVVVQRVDVDQQPELFGKYRDPARGLSLPQYVKLSNGQVMGRLVGYQPLDQLAQLWSRCSDGVPYARSPYGGDAYVAPGAPNFQQAPATFAAEQPKATSNPATSTRGAFAFAVVRVVCLDHDGGHSIGSGVMLPHGIVLANEHVVRDRADDFAADVYRSNNQSGSEFTVYKTQVVKSDRTWDLAALIIRVGHTDAPTVELADEVPRIGESLTIAGHGPGQGNYRESTGQVRTYASPTGSGPPDWLVIQTPARSGDSGGGVFNRGGRLSGILWGNGADNETRATQVGRIRLFLKSIEIEDRTPPLAAVPARPSTDAKDRDESTNGVSDEAAVQSKDSIPLEKAPRPATTPDTIQPAPGVGTAASGGDQQPWNRDSEAPQWQPRLEPKPVPQSRVVDAPQAEPEPESKSIGEAIRDKVHERAGQVIDVVEQAAPIVEPAADAIVGPALKAALIWFGVPTGGASLLALGGYLGVKWARRRLHAKLADQAGGPVPTSSPAPPAAVPAAVSLDVPGFADDLAAAGQNGAAASPAAAVKATMAKSIREYHMNDGYAEDRADKLIHQGMSLPQLALLGEYYQEALARLKNNEFGLHTSDADLANTIENWVMGKFLARHGVRATLTK